MIETVLFWSGVTLYGFATALYFVGIAFKKDALARLGLWACALGALPHAGSLVIRWAEVGHGPFQTRYEVFSGDAFVLVAAFLASAALSPRLRALGIFVAPVAFLLLGLAVDTRGLEAEVPIIFRSYWLALHIGFAKLFAATTVLASACAAAYLLGPRARSRLPRLPEPERLDLYAHQYLLVSFLFLGVMIAAGSLWAHQSWGRYWGWDPIETSALATWIGFGVILHFRVLHRWTGRRMAWLTLAGLGMSIVTVFAVALLVPTIHDSYLVGR